MIRSTRVLNLPDPRRFNPLFRCHRHLAPRRLAAIPIRNNLSNSRTLLSAADDSRRRTPPPAMDLDVAAGDDYVHVSAADRPESEVVPVVAAAEEELNPNPSTSQDSVGDGSADGGVRGLPDEIAKGVVVLECESSAEGGTCEVYLVGTAHVSQESCREVQAVIRHFKPQVVFLELCSSRVAILTPQNVKVPTVAEMVDMWKNKKMNTFGILYSWFLAKIADKLEVFPGSEFRVAFEETMSYGAKVILGDRPVHITLRRTWGKMTLWHKAKFLYSILFQAIFLPSPEDLNKMLKEMDDVDMLTLVIQEMSKSFPTLMETLLLERDLYMSSTLLKVAREHSSVVAVVGKGHLSGIKQHWKQPIEVRHLLEVPAKSTGMSSRTIWASIGLALTGVAIAAYLAGKR